MERNVGYNVKYSDRTETSRDRPKLAPYLRLKIANGLQTIGELGTLSEKKLKKKSRNAEKTERGDPWSCPVLYLREKPVWFSSLGQGVQFGGFLKFCKTFGVELFWSLQVYRKKH